MLPIAAAVALAGCQGPGLTPPRVTTSPYDSSVGEALWAVVPLRNDSGTTILNLDALSDAVVRSCQQIEGVRCLPLNRVLAEMRGLGMTSVASPSEARVLADRLGVNGLIIGAVTAFDPYDPPRIGLALALEGGQAFLGDPGGISVDELRGSVVGSAPGNGATARFRSLPSASVAVVFDGRNHGTQMELRRYARGRHEPGSAGGWRTYLKSMPLFTEFAAHAAVSRLVDEERLRLARARVSSR
ncbi:MAG: hypothetical protein AAFR96_07720 [Planctomycetota bacterium]